MTNELFLITKSQRRKFLQASSLVSLMNEYSYNSSNEAQKDLATLANITREEGVTLPNGGCGSAIALALLINDYVSAEYLIRQAEALGLNTKFVALTGGFVKHSLEDVYLTSLSLREDPEVIIAAFKATRPDLVAMQTSYLQRQEEACKRIGTMLGITVSGGSHFKNLEFINKEDYLKEIVKGN